MMIYQRLALINRINQKTRSQGFEFWNRLLIRLFIIQSNYEINSLHLSIYLGRDCWNEDKNEGY